MADRAPAWVLPAMRAGYAARGAVYLLIGALAVTAAWRGGQAEGAKGALAGLTDEAWGVALLWAIGIGFFCYAAWRLIAAWMDLERHGSDAKGAVARTGLIVTGIIHAALGVSAIRLAYGTGGFTGDGESQQRWTAWLLSQPFGKWAVIGIGLVVIGAGIYYGWKGLREEYKEHLRYTPTVERLDLVCKFGLLAYGAVIAMLGGFLLWAGWTSDASEAGGLEQAFRTVRGAAFGRVLLAVLGLGVIAFAVENFVESAYRVVPARTGPDVTTLAARARAAVRNAGADARARTL